ncbi:MAG: LysM peptidoglycan-binding domain-containing protein [Gemmatimonadales bacterium]
MPRKNAGKADFSDVKGGSSSSAPDQKAGSELRIHTVKSGDTLSRLAKQYYGDAGKWRVIHEANQDKIKNPDLIYPGQEFVIPEAPED